MSIFNELSLFKKDAFRLYTPNQIKTIFALGDPRVDRIYQYCRDDESYFLDQALELSKKELNTDYTKVLQYAYTSPLNVALKNGSLKTAKVFLKHQNLSGIIDDDTFKILINCIDENTKDLDEALTQAKKNISGYKAIFSNESSNPISVAVKAENLNAISVLLKHGACLEPFFQYLKSNNDGDLDWINRADKFLVRSMERGNFDFKLYEEGLFFELKKNQLPLAATTFLKKKQYLSFEFISNLLQDSDSMYQDQILDVLSSHPTMYYEKYVNEVLCQYPVHKKRDFTLKCLSNLKQIQSCSNIQSKKSRKTNVYFSTLSGINEAIDDEYPKWTKKLIDIYKSKGGKLTFLIANIRFVHKFSWVNSCVFELIDFKYQNGNTFLHELTKNPHANKDYFDKAINLLKESFSDAESGAYILRENRDGKTALELLLAKEKMVNDNQVKDSLELQLSPTQKKENTTRKHFFEGVLPDFVSTALLELENNLLPKRQKRKRIESIDKIIGAKRVDLTPSKIEGILERNEID